MDADIKFNSDSVVLVVVGRGPLGAFTAKVSAVQLEGDEGRGASFLSLALPAGLPAASCRPGCRKVDRMERQQLSNHQLCFVFKDVQCNPELLRCQGHCGA